MRLFDIHTHNINADKRDAILNCNSYLAGRNISIGLHPWNITQDWKEQFAKITAATKEKNVVAIGECGIDKLRSTADIEAQKEIFRAHAQLAERMKKPLIIHCVKAIDEILKTRNTLFPTQAWIIHNFRGNPIQAQQLCNAGLYLSFGEKHNAESIKATPLERLLVESDESSTPIANIYTAIAKAKEMSIEVLAQSIEANINSIIQF